MGSRRSDGPWPWWHNDRSNATGLQRATIRVGVRELRSCPSTSTAPEPVAEAVQRVRAAGGGRKPLSTEDPTLVRDLEALVEPVTRGDPMSPLALDVQEHPPVGCRTRSSGASSQPHDRSRGAARVSTTVCKPPERRRRAASIPIVMPNSRTSTSRRARSSSATNR